VKVYILTVLALVLGLSDYTALGKRLPVQAAAVTSSAADNNFENVPAQKVSDPFEKFNRSIFHFNDGLHTHAVRPLAHGYAAIVPRPVRTSIANFFDNLHYPVSFINSVLQGKFARSAQQTGQFLINSTAGIGGLFRVSDHISSLADVPQSDFGQTLGIWGVSAGPYLVVPLLGPSDFRDLVGYGGDFVMSPLNWHTIGLIQYEYISRTLAFALSGTHIVNGLPKTVQAYDELKAAAVDPYIATRNAYLSYRAAQLKK
jgi:phospholipid-binding lipoprotein MlaA